MGIWVRPGGRATENRIVHERFCFTSTLALPNEHTTYREDVQELIFPHFENRIM